jgi:hypothetical protein
LKVDQGDKNAIENLKRNPSFQKAFSGMSMSMSENLKKVIDDNYNKPGGFTIDNMVKDMRGELDVANNRLRMIARTETSKIASAARKNSYIKTGDFDTMKFEWIGPSDNRTGSDSVKIKSLTKGGVSWDELVSIIQNVAKERSSDWIVDSSAPIPRPNTRHVPIKVV